MFGPALEMAFALRLTGFHRATGHLGENADVRLGAIKQEKLGLPSGTFPGQRLHLQSSAKGGLASSLARCR